MFPMLLMAGAALGAMANKKNPLQGALMGAGVAATGGAAAGGLLGAGAAGAAGAGAAGGATAGAAGAGAASGAGGLLGSMGGSAGGGLMGSLGQAGSLMSTAQQTGLLGGGQEQPMQGAAPAFPANNPGAQTLTSLAQSGQQQSQNELMAADQARRKRRIGLLGEA
jgi:hypothetical protein